MLLESHLPGTRMGSRGKGTQPDQIYTNRGKKIRGLRHGAFHAAGPVEAAPLLVD